VVVVVVVINKNE